MLDYTEHLLQLNSTFVYVRESEVLFQSSSKILLIAH